MILTDLQWAIICTIHQEPGYQFIGNEKVAAMRMVKKGWLKRQKHSRFTVTFSGECAYDNDTKEKKRRAVCSLPKGFEIGEGVV
jgi:hypothetical protein